MYDTLLINGTLIDRPADLAIADGKIVAIGQSLGSARHTIDCTHQIILPGVIDSHVHFNDPGRHDWEGIPTGSRAAAAGGTTCFIDMPLNSIPATIDAASFDMKLAIASQSSVTDFALWGGLVPGNASHLPELASRGVIGFKAFMSSSGVDEFPRADDDTLAAGMRVAASLNLPVAVHAEDESLTQHLSSIARSAGKKAIRDYLASRPIQAELNAITTAVALSKEIGCPLHIVHVSTGQGIAIIAEARAAGVDVTCETCPHYLLLTAEDVERLGAVAKCAPPLRDRSEVESLWTHLAAGRIDMLASDHSPSPLSLKQSDDFFSIWGGIAGCQTLLSSILSEGRLNRQLPLSLLSRLLSANVAARFKLPSKGRLAVGYDADLVILDTSSPEPLTPAHLHYRHSLSPYLNLPLHNLVRQTIVRGITVYPHSPKSIGQFVRPA